MSTAIATGIEKTKIMELLRGAGTCGVAFSTDEEFIYLSLERNGFQHWLVVGEYGGQDVNGMTTSSHLRTAMKRGKRDSMVEFEQADDGIAVRIDGEVRWTIPTNGIARSPLPFDLLGDYQSTVPHEAAKAGSLIDWVCCEDEARFSLGAVRFEKQRAVATDGRRMNMMPVELEDDVVATVPSPVVDFAAKFGHNVLHHKGRDLDEYVVAGELIAEFKGRYPNWQQQIPSHTNEPVVFDSAAMLQNCQDHLDREDSESEGITLTLGDCKVLVNAKFMIELIRKLKLKTLVIETTFTEEDDEKLRPGKPIVVSSHDSPDWQQIVMPMIRD